MGLSISLAMPYISMAVIFNIFEKKWFVASFICLWITSLKVLEWATKCSSWKAYEGVYSLDAVRGNVKNDAEKKVLKEKAMWNLLWSFVIAGFFTIVMYIEAF